MWLPDLWELDIPHCFCLDPAKYDRTWHVGYFKNGWEYLCVGVRHMIQDYAQTVLHMPRCVPWVCLAGIVILFQIVVVPCGLVGCCSQLLYRFHSLFVRFESS